MFGRAHIGARCEIADDAIVDAARVVRVGILGIVIIGVDARVGIGFEAEEVAKGGLGPHRDDRGSLRARGLFPGLFENRSTSSLP